MNGSNDKAPVRPRILVVDDYEELRDMISAYADAFEVDSEVAENGLQAYNKVRTGSFDLVLMDLQMPVMDGFAALQKIRAEGHTLPVVAVTGHVSIADREKCRACGFDDFLSKPFEIDELRKLVTNHAFGFFGNRKFASMTKSKELE